MQAALASNIEAAAGRAASGSFALACAYAFYTAGSRAIGQPALGAYAAAAGAIAFLVSDRLMGRVGKGEPHGVPLSFDLFELPAERAEELLLTEVHQSAPKPAEPLVLDDILAELTPDSRVVRLFDRAAMSTPGALKSRIDAHLAREAADAPAPDASQALHDALAELRRSIR